MKTSIGGRPSADGSPSTEGETLHTLRLFLLALVVLGIVGFLAELFLLEHTESLSQLLPIAVLGAGLLSALAIGLRPTPRTVRIFQGLMLLLILSGILGLYLHYSGNAAFEREMDASAAGLGLVWQSLRGATPALAPGGLVHLGLLGLMHAYRHPVLRTDPDHREQEDV